MKHAPIRALALLTTGLLAGAFGYGAANLVPTFHRVPLQMRLEFHTELMQNNSISMQLTMAAAALSCLVLAVVQTGRDRALAAAAALLVVGSFLITRLGNVPINHKINAWAVDGAPADYADILARWDLFHFLRTGTALVAFALIITLVVWRAEEQKREFRRADEGVSATVG
ncbi:anthrone oxygenase family protein [Nocardia sp. NPDC060220]|uniref:anthrone oxygenase family protein n=1 Tax=Nocardia sp. NPDC060220 TaxID=3347076 RepID=UPI0036562D84